MSTSFVISMLFYAHVVPCVRDFIYTIPDRFRNFPIRYLSIVLGLAYLAIILFSYRRFQSLKEWYKRLRMHYKFMNALIKDVDQVSKKGKEIDEKAHQHWDSQLRPGATVQLSTDERAWVEKLREVVRNTNPCFDTFERLSGRRQFLKWLYTGLMDFRKIGGLLSKIDGAREEIFDLIYAGTYIDQILKSLESSRSNVRSLQDRPIVEEQSPYNRVERMQSTQCIEEKLNHLINGKPDLEWDRKEEIQYDIEFPLKLLLAFLEDLGGLRMESEMEKAWVEHAEDIILDLQHDMDRMRWLLYLGNWIARHQLKNRYDNNRRVLSSLIYRKSYPYNFKFVRRDPSKSVHAGSPQKQTSSSSSQATATDDAGFSSRLTDFCKQLNQEQGTDDFKELLGEFTDVQKLLLETTEVEGIERSRKVWTDQLKKIVEDAEKSFNANRGAKSSEWSENPNKTDSRSNMKEVHRFRSALYFLQTCITVCRIELREENNSVVGLEKNIHEVVSGLISNTENCSRHVILGMKGIGKTTLAKKVFDHRAIKHHFQKFRYWVPIDDIVDEDKNVIL